MIAEDSGLLRELLVEVLTGRGLRVTGVAGSKPEILQLVDEDPPDAVLLDIRMPPDQRDEGIQAAEEIRARHPDVGLLVLSHYAETSYAVRLVERVCHGVGYLVKDRVRDSARLVDAVCRVVDGEVVVDPDIVSRMMSRRRTADPLDRLTDAERRTLALVAEGHSNAAIARQMGCSTKTVEKYLTSIARKLDLPDAADAGRADVNVRVLAVLAYLRGAGPTAGPTVLATPDH